MSNLEARLARLEQQFSVLLANDNTRPALRSATAVPVKDAAVTETKLASAVSAKLWQGAVVLGGDSVEVASNAASVSSVLSNLWAASYPATLTYLTTSLPDCSVVVLCGNSSGTITVAESGGGTNRIQMASPTFDLTGAYDTILLIRAGVRWYELSRSSNT